jgi:electron transport complex protein RnfB
MHTVIESECTGCELCLPPCPVDCIDMVTPKKSLADWQWPRPAGDFSTAQPVRAGSDGR